MPKVVGGFVSFTEVTAADQHRAYNAWHLFDHLPEQLPLDGIVAGERWVLTPALRAGARAAAPLDRVHYVTLYLLAGDLDDTVSRFRALGQQLRDAGRFHLQRTAHLSGPLTLTSTRAAARVLVSPEAVPYRPNTGAYVLLERASAPDEGGALVEVPGVAGVWTFVGLRDLRLTWCWLDGDPALVAAELAPRYDGAVFAGALAAVDPRGPWDWFDSRFRGRTRRRRRRRPRR